MSTTTGLWLTIVLIGMFTLPGWAALALNHSWRQWKGLQRWIVAIGISIAFYPVLFYATRSVIPFLTFGPFKMGTLLLLCAIIIGWRMRGHWKEQFIFDRLEWVALGILGMTLFTRFWIIRDHPYPAWSDSLHHTLLTQLTAVQGKLPTSLEPYYPIPLGKYHLGLYALSATVQWLAQVPAHTALLWTAQVLNGLCGAGVYLVLDRKVGRLGAVVGAAVAGVLAHQPAFYVNWGRFTQISGQAILLIAWLITWEAIVSYKLSWREHKVRILWSTVLAATLTGAMFLLHFRVVAFYIPLLIISVIWELWKARQERQIVPVLLGAMAVGITALIVVAPALWQAAYSHVAPHINALNAAQAVGRTYKVPQVAQAYYEFPWNSLPILVARPWLMILASLAAAIGLFRRNKLVICCLLWMVTLYLVANAHVLGIPLLSITNLGAVLIMFYLPIGLIVGSAVQELVNLLDLRWREFGIKLTLGIILAASFVASHVRVTEIEPFRYFVTPEDVAAMHWINANTPLDALFAVNTYFWLPNGPHGTDAGYWIPYFTNRQTTVGAMINGMGAREYWSAVVETSHAVEQLEIDNASLPDLQAMGIDYVYVGRRGDFSGPGLNATQLSEAEGVRLLYQEGGVFIFQIE
ncbi:MAG: hypothetical protein GY832_00140 [Chloroflexi bacterium]|nr:hypothetical protein [Chloroflexota bacterium]